MLPHSKLYALIRGYDDHVSRQCLVWHKIATIIRMHCANDCNHEQASTCQLHSVDSVKSCTGPCHLQTEGPVHGMKFQTVPHQA